MSAQVQLELGQGAASTPAAEGRRARLLALLEWAARVDPQFSVSPKLRFLVSACGGCRVEAVDAIPAGTLLLSANNIPEGGAGDAMVLAETAAAVRRRMVELGLGTTWLFPDDLAADAALVERTFALYLRLMLELLQPDAGEVIGPYLRSWPPLSAAEQELPLFWPAADVAHLAGTHAHTRIKYGTEDIDRIGRDVIVPLAARCGLTEEAAAAYGGVARLFKYVVATSESRAFGDQDPHLTPVADLLNGCPDGYNSAKTELNMVQGRDGGWANVTTISAARPLCAGEEVLISYGELGSA